MLYVACRFRLIEKSNPAIHFSSPGGFRDRFSTRSTVAAATAAASGMNKY